MTWTLEQLAERAARALVDAEVRVANGRVTGVPDGRLIRWYTTIGLLDRPVIGPGRVAQYGPRHLLQLVAVKRLQAQGAPLAEIQLRLAGATDSALQRNPKLLWLLVLGSVPAGIAGLLVKDLAENVWRNNQYLIGSMLILVGLFMWWADKQGTRNKDLGSVSPTDSLTIGAAQALALVPGVSRSGITICAGLLRHLDRASAARFSFLLATPAIAGAAAKDAWDLMRHGGGIAGIPQDMRTALVVGMVVSAITGALTIQFFLNYLRRKSLTFFVWYRVIFGIIVIALATFFRYHGG